MSLVYLSIIVIILSSAFILLVARWNSVELSDLEDRAREYHLSTISGADRIEQEIFRLLKADKEQHSLTGRTDDDQISPGDDARDRSIVAFDTWVHVIEARLRALRDLQARYRDAEYARTLARAIRHFDHIAAEGSSRRALLGYDAEGHRLLHRRVDALLIAITQLRKLHASAYRDAVNTIAVRRQESTRNFAILLVATLGLTGLVVFQLLRLINHGIIRQQETEQALRRSESALQERVSDLEEMQCKLERQGQDLARFAEELRRACNREEIANRSKSEFLAMMSHELRTPLNAIIGFSDVIKNETFGPVGNARYRTYGKDINESGQHLLALVNDILDLSKVESGSDELQEQQVEIPEIVRSVLGLLRMRAVDGGLALELDLSEKLPLLHADERKLKQILSNLITNAIKFTDPGGTVTLRSWCGSDNALAIEIADTGVGIEPDDIPKALSKFTQVQNDPARQHEGTGLGLPLTKALVEQHGGVLDLRSEVGVGTTITVRFPAERTARVPQHTQPVGLRNGTMI